MNVGFSDSPVIRSQPDERMKRRKSISRTSQRKGARLSPKQEQPRVRELKAINLVRRGKSTSLSAAARTAGTTVDSIQRLLPKALFQSHRGGRIQVKASDPYTALVEIITDLGPMDVTARGSRERQLAGRHRAVVMRVLRGDEPDSSKRSAWEPSLSVSIRLLT
jgi:hypothetical protein